MEKVRAMRNTHKYESDPLRKQVDCVQDWKRNPKV